MMAAVLCGGRASGPLLRLDEPLSFWGGSDVQTGEITDVHHPQRGRSAAGRVLAMSASRGSSSSSTVLAEQLRCGVAPSGILLRQPDAILALAAIVGRELYGIQMPVVVLAPADFDALPPAGTVTITADGDTADVKVGPITAGTP